MKTKKVNNKLSLKKETIVLLNSELQSHIEGGLRKETILDGCPGTEITCLGKTNCSFQGWCH